ncbi:MAG: TetR/AcrR family transcriptional regulator [Planctomycetes bacterium]|nr:TetR/AcrR family transcriptional regulator [Planctomycetota bacterium]
MSLDVKRKIAAVAAKLFAQKGFAATSIREIEEKAGVGRPMIYYYFGDKQGLYTALLNEAVEPLSKQMIGVAEQSLPPPDKIRAIVGSLVAHYRENPDLFRLVNTAIERRDPQIDRIVGTYFRGVHAAITGILREGVQRGDFKNLIPEAATFSIFAIITHAISREDLIAKVADGRFSTADYLDNLGELIVTLLSK